ncbi:MAG: hypothetical protein EOO27_38260 [Comamonadaceae bacterium]|nr:MAG: hypothetical protein EOO27_38260 [Comamonadaceae bacterium]
MANPPTPDSAEPFENRSKKPLPPSTKVDQDNAKGGDRGPGARTHREQSEQVKGVPGREDEDADPVG